MSGSTGILRRTGPALALILAAWWPTRAAAQTSVQAAAGPSDEAAAQAPDGAAAQTAAEASAAQRLAQGAVQTPAPSSRPVDEWQAPRNPALGVGEILLVNIVPWAVNEYIRNANFSQINPRSWYDNLTGGWEWDDNNFSTNMFAHPFHGNLYYNSGRTNGLSYWASIPFAFGGSLIWECCGETHPPAINDWLNTSLGGIAIGETLYRLSSTILDNQATGAKRVWTEIGAAALNPVRGFNRLVTGRIGKVYENPTNPYDHLPPHLSNVLAVGVRSVRDSGNLESKHTAAFFDVDFQFGSVFQLERNKPFDFFVMGLQVNFRDKQAIGRWQIRGSLTKSTLRDDEKVKHRLLLVQNFDYFNNNAFEFGGQSVSGALLSGWFLSPRWAIATHVDVTAQIMGAVNFAGASLQDFPTQERLREYDFGPGFGSELGFILLRNNVRVFDLSYRMTWMDTVNGAVIRTDQGDVEDQATHLIQMFYARARVPVHRNFSLGVDFLEFVRDTNFSDPDFADDLHQRVRELRVFLAWSVGRGSAER